MSERIEMLLGGSIFCVGCAFIVAIVLIIGA